LSDYDEFEQTVIGWIADWRGAPKTWLTPATSLNVGRGALGIEGDDAAELIRYLATTSGVKFSDFEYDRFFGLEGFPWLRLAEWLRGREAMEIGIPHDTGPRTVCVGQEQLK
jgi:hypothetical protein